MDDQAQQNSNSYRSDNTNPVPVDNEATFYPQNNQQAVTSAPATTQSPDRLLEIKRQALAQLTPMINNLDQNPEDRFRTIMMMIQASDNQDLINTAYEAAEKITDEKARAQALLDIVNEINYFTQQASK